MTIWKPKQVSLISLAALLALTAIPRLQVAALSSQPLLAEASAPGAFPVPQTVAEGTTVKVDGSSGIDAINRTLKQTFEKKFSGTQVQFASSGSNAALQSLRDGKIDLAAISRPLTAAEQAEGFVAVPVARNKIAMIVAPNSPFRGTLTIEQVAKIFRGEITDWSEIDSAVSGAVRIVDRPVTSDIRRSFQGYSVFQGAPFETGDEAVKVEDSTAAVAAKLGMDGLGYAIADQVLNKAGVRIVPLYGNLPDQPGYPFSQPLAYVYKGAPSPGIQAFLGFATAPENQSAIEQARHEAALSAPGALSGATMPGMKSATQNPEPSGAAQTGTGTAQNGGNTAKLDAPGASPKGTGSGNTAPGSTTVGTDAARPQSDSGTDSGQGLVGGFLKALNDSESMGFDVPGVGRIPLRSLAWLLLPLIGLPLLAWLLKGGAEAASEDAVGIANPTALPLPGGEDLAGHSRIILTPRNCRDAYAFWEISDEAKAAIHEQGGRTMALRLHDVTGIDMTLQAPHSVRQFNCRESDQDKHLPIALDDRDYLVELGYVTDGGDWISLVCSEPARIPKCSPAEEPSVVGITGSTPGTKLFDPTGAPIEQAPTLAGAIATGGAVAGAGLARTATPDIADSGRIVLVPRSSQTASAHWELPEAAYAELQGQGRDRLSIRLYDVTHISLDRQPPNSIKQFDGPITVHDVPIPIAVDNRDYLVELGYVNSDRRWVRLARSEQVHVPQCDPIEPSGNSKPDGIATPAASPASALSTLFEGDRPLPQPTHETHSVSQITLVLQQPMEVYAQWQLTTADIETAKQQGAQRLSLRLYDVTSIDFDQQPPYSVSQVEVDELSQNCRMAVQSGDRDYLVEIGYTTGDGRWLRLARSQHVHVPAAQPSESWL